MFGIDAFFRLLGAGSSARSVARDMVARADAARDAGSFAEAAFLYDEAARIRPGDAGVRIQAGHMHKEAGALDDAALRYAEAQALTPDDADLAMQIGHLHKRAGRIPEAREAYLHSIALKPGWMPPADELRHLSEHGYVGIGALAALPDPLDRAAGTVPPLDFSRQITELGRAGSVGRLVPDLEPGRPEDLLHEHHEHIDVRRLGRREPGHWGTRRTVRGVEAIRGFCLSETPIVELQIIMNGLTIHRGPLRGPYDLPFERDKARIKKYVFNVWHDFSGYAEGHFAIELRFTHADNQKRGWHDRIVVGRPVPEDQYPDSDALVSLTPGDLRSPDEQIRARPSMVRRAERSLFPDGVNNVLVTRTDQLGDLVASIPAMRRLRELVPDAKIVGLLTIANAELARTLDLFDELIVIDFPDDLIERRRLMPLVAQDALRERLAPYRFEIALDLAQSNVSRDVLQLSGARFIFGTGGGDWPWLSGDFIFNTHDRWNGMDFTPHSTKVLALVNALGALLAPPPPVICRDSQNRGALTEYGIGHDVRYAVLHAGARIGFSRWPHYAKLAEEILDSTDLTVVMMSEDAGFRETLPDRLLSSDRFLLIDRRLTFDAFDAFLSEAAVVVGNDSGPKHLASLRGTPTITLFTARINWNEWGQETGGVVISRRVPCAGCALFHDPEECGKDFTCIRDIRVDEVLAALQRYV